MNTKTLHWFSLALVLCTFVLICSGGLVTSKGVGMSVPDWPTTYGYNMFLFPFSMWQGGIFFEHLHRLMASAVGFLTLALCIWLWLSDSRKWLKWLGVVALFAVVFQAVLGGLRVTLMKDQIGIFHGCLAQAFLLLTAFLALVTSQWWRTSHLAGDPSQHFARTALFLTVLIFINMAIAATMRHAHTGLSIPDFPAVYGKVLPPLDASSLEKINRARIAENQPETSASLIGLQFGHRLIAYFLGIAIPWFCVQTYRAGGVLKKWALLWPVLVFIQILLGAWTIWSNKAADVATAHVAVGACLFVVSGIITSLCLRSRWEAKRSLVVAQSGSEISQRQTAVLA